MPEIIVNSLRTGHACIHHWSGSALAQIWAVYCQPLIPINSSPLNKMANIFADEIFKRIFLNENIRISIKIRLKFVPRGSNDNKLALVQVMAWRCTGDKPLSELMWPDSLTHICGTRGRWFKSLQLIWRSDIHRFSSAGTQSSNEPIITQFTDLYRLQCVKFSKVKNLSRSSQGRIALCLPHIHYEVTSRSWCPQGVWSNGLNGHFNLVCWYNHTLLTHWSRVTHICVGNLAIIGSDNGLSPGRRQAIIGTNAGILLIGP